MKLKVLCVCSMGLNRSKYLASYLRNKGYKTRFEGIGGRIRKDPYNPFNQEDIDWADIIIVVRKKHVLMIKKKYKVKNKKVIALEVLDSRKRIGQKYPKLNNLDFETFQKRWTRPQLRKAIKSYLPLKLK